MDINTAYKNFAFISYSHRDMKLAKWLQHHLENYRLPVEIHNDIDAQSRYIRPVFRDQSDLNSGILNDELRRSLLDSKYLILLCSPHSAQSKWVSDEARTFVEAGRLDRIIPLMIPEGGGNERDLFPAYLREYFDSNPDRELLGVNIDEVGREKAFVRIVSRLLDVSYDSLWKRHLRHKRLKTAALSLAALIILAVTYLFAIPVTVSVNVDLQQSQLPTSGDVALTVNDGTYTSTAADPQFSDIRLPGYKRFTDIHIVADAKFFQPVDTLIPTGFGIGRTVNLELRRDDSFSWFEGEVLDERLMPIPGVLVTVASDTTITNREGSFSIRLPLHRQQVEHSIELSYPGYQTIHRPDEVPGRDLKFIMHPL